MLSIFYQFDPEEEDGSRQGKITKDNFVMCLQTISKLLSQQKCTFVIFFADLKVRKYLFTRDTSIISARTSCQLIQNLKTCMCGFTTRLQARNSSFYYLNVEKKVLFSQASQARFPCVGYRYFMSQYFCNWLLL